MSSNDGVTICILTFNRASVLRELLRSLVKIEMRGMEIIVIDNCSEDGTKEMIRSEFPEAKYERTEKNIGATARNIGLKKAKNEIVVTLDDDILGLKQEDLITILQLFQNKPEVGACNFQVRDWLTANICNWVHHRSVEEYAEREFLTYEITEGAVAFRRSALEKSGYYPDYFFMSHEGPDLALRLLDHGYDVIYSPKIQVKHKHSDLGRNGWLNYYYDTRNQFWLAARNFPCLYSTFYLARGLGAMLLYSIRDGYLRFWGKALFDGLSGLPRALSDRKVISSSVMQRIREIDKSRPGTVSLLWERLSKKEARL